MAQRCYVDRAVRRLQDRPDDGAPGCARSARRCGQGGWRWIVTTDAMKDSIAHIVRVAARDGAAIGPERLLAYLPSTSVDDAIADLDRAITAHVEAEVARRLAAAPDVEVAIVDYALAAQGDFDTSEERDALRAAIAADKARAVEAAIEGTGRAEQFADAICHRVGARDSGCGGQTVEAGTARLYADAAKRIDDLVARDEARPTPDEARRLVDAFVRAVSPARYDKDTALTARAALLRALGVEA